MDLINREKLKSTIRAMVEIPNEVRVKVLGAISREKAVDAVPVVRCKDCKHKGWIQEPCHGRSVDYCRALDFCINNADKCFCYYGERRADNA